MITNESKRYSLIKKSFFNIIFASISDVFWLSTFFSLYTIDSAPFSITTPPCKSDRPLGTRNDQHEEDSNPASRIA